MNGDQNPQNPPVQPAPTVNGKATVIEKIRSSSNILVAVSANPSVDQLSAAIALTLILEKYKKNATAVFSGKVPRALDFLKPGETFEKTTDSLRDFIIALDKSKADKLRYKVEDDVVKIFITPYKTSITEKDLQYNAGDFNVDVIIALGVHHQQDLDTAITAHGRIFHDAVVVSINSKTGGDFGIGNWEELQASSLSEMITGLADELAPGLLDTEISTALLTGIVAETSRFSNANTHPNTMTVSSVLLQAGADQTLVNTQLQSLIGTVVNLEAGSEIKPTITASERDEHSDSEPEELVIGKDGSLQSAFDAKTDDSVAEAPADEPLQSDKPETATLTQEAEVATSSKPETIKADASKPKSVDPTPQDLIQPPTPLIDEEETDDARQAVENALGSYEETGTGVPAHEPLLDPTPVIDEPAIDAQPPVFQPMPDTFAATDPTQAPAVSDGFGMLQPPTTPTEPNFGSQAPLSAPAPSLPQAPDLNPLTGYSEAPSLHPFDHTEPVSAGLVDPTAGAQPATVPLNQEQAPLVMSPADQAFTMPMPPVNAISQAPPVVGADPSAQNAMQTPPPLPPAMTPPSFGGSGR